MHHRDQGRPRRFGVSGLTIIAGALDRDGGDRRRVGLKRVGLERVGLRPIGLRASDSAGVKVGSGVGTGAVVDVEDVDGAAATATAGSVLGPTAVDDVGAGTGDSAAGRSWGSIQTGLVDSAVCAAGSGSAKIADRVTLDAELGDLHIAESAARTVHRDPGQHARQDQLNTSALGVTLSPRIGNTTLPKPTCGRYRRRTHRPRCRPAHHRQCERLANSRRSRSACLHIDCGSH